MPRVTRKGQVTIPRQIRSILSIRTGDEIIFEVDVKKIILKKNLASAKNLKKYVGYFSHLNGKSPNDIIDEARNVPNNLKRCML
ncbi:MAG: AbrB/MazE/SpoVT family DNA-binding domain-containing protein [Dehalococcoidales bacterium]|nr:AbrB/MazE/SpoVT family DNA-binding domain-containing protein [Dehalococcoidales bacterium]